MKKKSLLILLASVLLVIGAGIAAIFLFAPPTEEAEKKKIGEIAFTPGESFYSGDIEMQMEIHFPAQSDYTLYYTLNGNSVYTEKRNRFTYNPERPVKLSMETDISVTLYTVRAAAQYGDGSWSEESVHTYFMSDYMDERFDCKVVSLTTDKANLYGETGIFDNYEGSGLEWEREVHVEILSSDGQTLIDQPAGIRVHGGWSRTMDLKSLRLYARQEYGGEEYKYFNYPLFSGNTDASGKEIPRYKRLLLRNSGNDLNDCFVRDALIQHLSAEAGFPDTEACEPCAVFLNGEYQGFYWLQEYVGERYFEAHYGKQDGDFEKDDHRDPNLGQYQYVNAEFLDLAELDLTDDANFKLVTDQIDIENYMFFYAINTLVDNEDWPQNNTLMYRYRPASGAGYGSGHLDGKWRYVIHDEDLAFKGVTNHLSTDCLLEICDPDSRFDRTKDIYYIAYSPLFVALTKREDMRQLYCKYLVQIHKGAFSETNMKAVLDRLVKASDNELSHYFVESPAAKGYNWKDYQNQLKVITKQIDASWNSIKRQTIKLWNINLDLIEP